MDKLRAIEYFVHTVEAGSMAAARHLEVSPPAITKQIAALERELGITLLRRESRKLLLTDDGDRYLKACTRRLDELRLSWNFATSTTCKSRCPDCATYWS